MPSSLRYNFHGNWRLLGKKLFLVHVLTFNTDIKFWHRFIITGKEPGSFLILPGHEHEDNKSVGFEFQLYHLTFIIVSLPLPLQACFWSCATAKWDKDRQVFITESGIWRAAHWAISYSIAKDRIMWGPCFPNLYWCGTQWLEYSVPFFLYWIGC